MKRSRNINLLLTGALLAGSLIGCSDRDEEIDADREYENNSYCSGVGYYHAPYHNWYPYPYNHYDPQRGYFHGGSWSSSPETPSVSSSRPSTEATAAAKSARASRGGFGRSGFHFGGS